MIVGIWNKTCLSDYVEQTFFVALLSPQTEALCAIQKLLISEFDMREYRVCCSDLSLQR